MNHTTIELGDRCLRVYPTYPESLLKKLKFWKRELEWSEERMARISTGHYQELYTISKNIDSLTNVLVETLVTYAGLAHRVKQHLEAECWTYDVIDKRTKFIAPDFKAAFAHLRNYQYESVYMMLMSLGGVASAPTGFGKTALIAGIAQAFPHESLKLRGTPTIVIAAPDKDINRKNYNDFINPELNFMPGRDVGLLMSGHNKISDDVQVVTLGSLHRLNPNDVGVLIIDEVHTAASSKRSEVVMSFPRALRYGVSATPSGRYDGADLMTEAMFGPPVYTCTYAQAVEFGALVPISVFWIECPEPGIGIGKYLNYKTRDGKVRHGIIRNKPRNVIIADLLKKLPEDMQALCITQRIEHLQYMLEQAPDIDYVHGTTRADKVTKFPLVDAVTTKERIAKYNLMRDAKINRMFSTYIYKQGVNFPELELVINAGGGGSEIVAKQIPGRESRKVDGKEKAILIDFCHPWDTVTDKAKIKPGPLAADDKSREKAYKNLGFEQVWLKSIDELPMLQ